MAEEKMQLLPIQGMNDLSVMGTTLEKSGMFGLEREGSGLVIAMTCYMQKITPLDFLRTYHIIENKPAMRADAMAAKFREAGGRYKVVKRSDTEAAAKFFIEEEGVEYDGSCKMTDMKKQGVCYKKDGKTVKNTWDKYPAEMLWARMMSGAVRVLMPEIVAGTYTPEEIGDFDDPNEPKEEKVINPEVAEKAVKKAVAKKPAPKKPKEEPKPDPKKEEVIEVKAEVVEETPEKETPKEEPPAVTPDYTLCPMDPKLGIPFAELTTEDLEALSTMGDHPKMKGNYIGEIGKELEKRKQPVYE